MDPRMMMQMMQMGGGGPSRGASGLSGILSGLFEDASSPYNAAMGPYRDWMNKGANALNPFVQGGQQGMGNFQNWLKGMQDPSKFINNIMGQYQESPYAKYQQQQGIRAAGNMGSATGLLGSTPLMQQTQQNAQNISSGDMNQWLQNVLGVNTQYGAGQEGLMNMGAGAANSLSNLYQNMGQGMGNLEYGARMGQNQNMGNIFGGLASLF